MLPNFVKYGMIKSNMDKSFSEKRRQQIIIAWRQITLFGLVTISTLNFTGTNTLEQVQHHTYRLIGKGTRFFSPKIFLKDGYEKWAEQMFLVWWPNMWLSFEQLEKSLQAIFLDFFLFFGISAWYLFFLVDFLNFFLIFFGGVGKSVVLWASREEFPSWLFFVFFFGGGGFSVETKCVLSGVSRLIFFYFFSIFLGFLLIFLVWRPRVCCPSSE